MLIGCILVVFVLLMFLFQWRAALVSLLAIPLSLAAAEIVLVAMGTTINTMILAGFASRSGSSSTTRSSTWRTSCGGCAPGGPRGG